MLSRILGFIRDITLARLFGASVAMDAFFVAFKIPNFMRRLFAEGSFSLAFVPVLSQMKSENNREHLAQFLNHTYGCLLSVLTPFTIIGVMAAPVFVIVFAPGFIHRPEQFGQAVDMLRLTFPYLMLISLCAMAAGILQTHGRFAPSAFSPVLLNLSLIGFAILISPRLQLPVMALAWGVLVAGVLQLVWHLFFLRQIELLPRPVMNWHDPKVRSILKLMLPTLLGSSVAQINLLFDTLIASMLVTGSVSWLYYADRLMELPLGVFGVAIATIILPRLSTHHSEKNHLRFHQTIQWASRSALLVAVPAATGLVVLAEPITSTLFESRNFSSADTHMVALALSAYTLGIPAFILAKVLVPVYYARLDTRTPVIIALWCMSLNMIFNIILVGLLVWKNFPAPHMGLALASAMSAWLQVFLLIRWMNLSIKADKKAWWSFNLRLGLASLIMGLMVSGISSRVPDWSNADTAVKILWLTISIGVGIIAFGAAGMTLGLSFLKGSSQTHH